MTPQDILLRLLLFGLPKKGEPPSKTQDVGGASPAAQHTAQKQPQGLTEPPTPTLDTELDRLRSAYERASKLANIILPKQQPVLPPAPPSYKLREFARNLAQAPVSRRGPLGVLERIGRIVGAGGLGVLGSFLPPDNYQREVYETERAAEAADRQTRQALTGQLMTMFQSQWEQKKEAAGRAPGSFMASYRSKVKTLSSDPNVAALLSSRESRPRQTIQLAEPMIFSAADFAPTAAADPDSAQAAAQAVASYLSIQGAQAETGPGPTIVIKAIPVSVSVTEKTTTATTGDKLSRTQTERTKGEGEETDINQIVDEVIGALKGALTTSETSSAELTKTYIVSVRDSLSGTEIASTTFTEKERERQTQARVETTKEAKQPKQAQPPAVSFTRLASAPPNVDGALQQKKDVFRDFLEAAQSVLGRGKFGTLSEKATELAQKPGVTFKDVADAARSLQPKLAIGSNELEQIYKQMYMKMVTRDPSQANEAASLVKGLENILKGPAYFADVVKEQYPGYYLGYLLSQMASLGSGRTTGGGFIFRKQ